MKMLTNCMAILRTAAYLAVLSATCAVPAQANPEDTLVIDNVNLVDATGSPVQMFMTVVVSGGKIEQIDRTGEIPSPTGATVIDATGRYLIPGLWDMHVHATEHEYVEDFPDHKKIVFPLLVANGVTGIREMGANWELLKQYRAEIRRGTLLGPRIIACGPMLDGPGESVSQIRDHARRHDARAGTQCSAQAAR